MNLCWQSNVMSLLFNMLSSLVIAFLPWSRSLLISWLQSPSAVILEPPQIKSATVSTVSPSICPWNDGTGCHHVCFLNVELNVGLWIPRLSYRNNNPLQYFCLENPMNRGAWLAIVDRVVKSGTGLRDRTTHHMRNSSSEVKHQGNNYTFMLFHQGPFHVRGVRQAANVKAYFVFCFIT